MDQEDKPTAEHTPAVVRRVSPIPNAKPWQPGQSGNPKGRPAAGASVVEWFNQMATWSDKDVAAVLRDKTASKAKKAAARCWQHATSLKTNASGNPIAGGELDRILDRTIGKAIQTQATLTLGAGTLDISRLAPDQLDQLKTLLALCVSSPLESPPLPAPESNITTADK